MTICTHSDDAAHLAVVAVTV